MNISKTLFFQKPKKFCPKYDMVFGEMVRGFFSLKKKVYLRELNALKPDHYGNQRTLAQNIGID